MRIPILLCWLGAVLFVPNSGFSARPRASVKTADGETIVGELSGLSSENVTMSIENPARALAGKDLLEIRFDHQRLKPHLFGAVIFLANGDRLVASPETMDDTQAIARWQGFPAWESVKIPLETISAFILQIPETAAGRSRVVRTALNRRQTADVADLKNRDQAAGEFVNLTQTALTLSGPAGDTPIPRESIQLVTMNRDLISFPKPKPQACLISMTDGSRITANRLSFDGKETFKVESAFGATFDLPVHTVISIRFLGGRTVYLSDLEPSKYEHQPYLSSEWKLKADSNILGEPLRLDGIECPKGLGMHSQSLVTYELDGQYQSFQATIGLDDAAGNKGSVVFAVEVDGQEVFRSKPQTGLDKPHPLKSISVKGAKQLTLKVLFAEYGDVLDYANWCDAALVKAN